MQIIHTEDFDCSLDRLPKHIHRLLKIQEEGGLAIHPFWQLKIRKMYLSHFYSQE